MADTYTGDYPQAIQYGVPYAVNGRWLVSTTGHSAHNAYEASTMPPIPNLPFFADHFFMLLTYTIQLWQGLHVSDPPFDTVQTPVNSYCGQLRAKFL